MGEPEDEGVDADNKRPLTKKDMRVLMEEYMGGKRHSSTSLGRPERKRTRKAKAKQKRHAEVEDEDPEERLLILVRLN